MDLRNLEPYLIVLDRLGISEPVLNMYSKLTNRYSYLDEVDERISNYHSANKTVRDGKILFPLLHTQGSAYLLYAGLAHMFECRGYEPLILSCDSFLPICLRKKNRSDSEGTCVNCYNETKKHLNAFNFQSKKIDQYIDNKYDSYSNVSTDINKYKQIDVANLAMASTRNHLRKWHIDFSSDEERAIYHRYLTAGVLLVDATENILEEENIIATIGHHPGYIYPGIILETINNRTTKPAITLGGKYLRKDAVTFGNMENEQGFPMFSDKDEVNQIISKSTLTKEKRDRIDELMSDRRSGSIVPDTHTYVKNANEDIVTEIERPLIGIFPNLVWDGKIKEIDILFEDMFDWIRNTLNHLGEFDVSVIVKPHPREQFTTNESIGDWIVHNMSCLPDNMTLLDSDTDIDPYKLMSSLDVGLVYSSTIGFEMAYYGCPVIVSGGVHYRDLGFTFDPSNIKEYFSLLGRQSELKMSEEMKLRAKKYVYFLMCKKHIKTAFSNFSDRSDIESIKHGQIRESEQLDQIVNQILSNCKTITTSDKFL